MCGRPAAHLNLPDAVGYALFFSLLPDDNVRHIRLSNPGLAPLRVEVSVQGPGVAARVRVIPIPGGTPEQPGAKLLDLLFDRDIPAGEASLILAADLGCPSLERPWDARPREERRVSLRWEARQPGKLVVLTPTLLFHGRQERKRTLRARNEGDLGVNLVLPALTHGFTFTGDNARQREVMPGEEINLDVEYCGAMPMPSHVSEAALETTVGDVPFRIVAEAEPAGRSRPDWIVGVDFGTSNTSVVARPIPRSGPPDQGACIPILGPGGQNRFPSAMFYLFREGRWLFGTEALQTAENQGASETGYLIHDHNSLKMSLSRPGEFYHQDAKIQANPFSLGAFTIDNLLRTYFTYLRDTLIHPYLREHLTAPVQYVLSLPVLDGVSGERYGRQRSRVLSAFSHVFQVPAAQIITELEPNCASRYLLLGPGYAHLQSLIPHAGSLFQPGERFMVVDSGGGTTDIAFGEFGEGSGGVLPFQVLGNLGLGEEGDGGEEDFGGRKMSSFLHAALNTAATEQFHHAPCDLKPQMQGQNDERLRRRTCSAISIEIEKSIKPPYCCEDPPEGLPAELVQSTREYATSQMKALLVALHKTHPEAFTKKLRWLFLVGGNTLVRAVQAFCLDRLANYKTNIMPDLAVEDRFLAVAMGAAYPEGLFVPEYSRYALSLRLVDQAGAEAVYSLQAKSAPIAASSRAFPYDGPVRVALQADGANLVLQRVGVAHVRTEIRAVVGPHGIRLTAQTEPSPETVLYEAGI